jgi:hypothetical protein
MSQLGMTKFGLDFYVRIIYWIQELKTTSETLQYECTIVQSNIRDFTVQNGPEYSHKSNIRDITIQNVQVGSYIDNIHVRDFTVQNVQVLSHRNIPDTLQYKVYKCKKSQKS